MDADLSGHAVRDDGLDEIQAAALEATLAAGGASSALLAVSGFEARLPSARVADAVVVITKWTLLVLDTADLTITEGVAAVATPAMASSLARLGLRPPRRRGQLELTVDPPHHRVSLVPREPAAGERLHAELAAAVARARARRPTAETGWLAVTVLAAHGYPLESGSAVAVARRPDHFMFATEEGRTIGEVPFDRLTSIEVGGPGIVTSGGGFVGGGFGVSGFLVGAGAAAVMNRLTTRSAVQTLLRIATLDGEVTMFTSQLTPELLDAELGAARTAITRRSHDGGVAAPSSTADELAKLAQLHRDGALDDAEFAVAKARLLHDRA